MFIYGETVDRRTGSRFHLVNLEGTAVCCACFEDCIRGVLCRRCNTRMHMTCNRPGPTWPLCRNCEATD